jgi:hypothetical protein
MRVSSTNCSAAVSIARSAQPRGSWTKIERPDVAAIASRAGGSGIAYSTGLAIGEHRFGAQAPISAPLQICAETHLILQL